MRSTSRAECGTRVRARAWRLAAGAAAALAWAAGCGDQRERLDVPRLVLSVDQQSVMRGTSATGKVTATDASGLVYIRITARAGTRILSQFPPEDFQGNLYDEDSISFSFSLPITCEAPDGAAVEIQARTFDNQGFEALRYDTVTARGAGSCTDDVKSR